MGVSRGGLISGGLIIIVVYRFIGLQRVGGGDFISGKGSYNQDSTVFVNKLVKIWSMSTVILSNR